ncbi:flagellar hook-basal body complex protein [Flintibacter muris]|uniref:flagellar hook-basal body complex protein n=1 Tax=Flintibacter muris TaxID=2941327 RepID=UPI00203F1DE5|nr:flagellar hook-basal body complex protein [Flintibacter muris]
MTGAMYAAIGGLKAHMTKLNVIGNNVANVNTYGYKAQRMTFRESIYTTSKSGSNGGVTMGGNNPSQIGYGCSVGSIDLNMSPSTYAPTGVGLDCMLTGEGFFMVGDKLEKVENEDGTVTWVGGITSGNDVSKMDLTRVGDFWVDPDGYICNRDNKVLYGFARVQNPDYKANATAAEIEAAKQNGKDITSKTIISSHLVPLRVPLSAAAPTTTNGGITAGANGGADVYNWQEGDPVYPFLSAATGGTNQYATPGVNADLTGGANKSCMAVAENTAENAVSDVMPIQLKSMKVGPDGSITGIAPNGDTVVVGYVAVATVDSPDGVTHQDGCYYKAMGGAGNVRVSTLGIELPTAYLGNKVAPDTQNAAAGTTAEAIDAVLIEKTTQIKNGGLEASSTDVANEFAEMITTQRGYQANTRIVTVTDSMLEELVNMKR